MSPSNLKELFKQFLHGYISAEHTVNDESEKEVKCLTDEYFEGFNVEDLYFTSSILIDYLDYLKDNLNEEHKRLYDLNYNEYLHLWKLIILLFYWIYFLMQYEEVFDYFYLNSFL